MGGGGGGGVKVYYSPDAVFLCAQFAFFSTSFVQDCECIMVRTFLSNSMHGSLDVPVLINKNTCHMVICV